jgi:hypothetical protein
MADTVFLLQLFSTIAMVGLIWFVQVVHYPLMERVGEEEFCRYEREHQRRTTMVVAPLMLTEAGTALLLLWIRPSSVPFAPGLVGLILLAVVWLSTYLWQVPIHRQLAVEYQVDLIRRLVRSNWLRTVAWSARGVVMVWMATTRFSGS